MNQMGYVTGIRRTYNQWVANETLEDFALRFTARRARKWSSWRVANTAIGSISFLALEAIGGAVTVAYGFDNALAAILLAGVILFLTGLPISYHAAKAGVDIDLLTRGAGFGYLGSTITSLIYAGFTFIFFALEAAILSQALEICFGLPIGFGYLLNALLVIPLVTHGFTRIGAFQMWTQPVWLLLHLIPFVALAWMGTDLVPWVEHIGRLEASDGMDIVLIASATGIVLSLSAQIGEQVDFLRFLPEPKSRTERRAWWIALVSAGPGWAVVGTIKMLLGSFLAVLIMEAGTPAEDAVEPTRMYLFAFETAFTAEVAILATAAFVILSQLKINVTNAYAGSIAWSNFFSRLTHHHPGRVVWLVFNVAIALLLMEFGVFGALESTLAVYSHVALAWIGAVTADLVVNMQLGLRPKRIEFRRGGLYDINPVGTGAMVLATLVSFALWFGTFGEMAAAFSSLSALGTAFVAAPLIAVMTKGRYYIARDLKRADTCTCTICQNTFDTEDMLHCPFHAGPICSLCCSLEARCNDACKPKVAQAGRFARSLARKALPRSVANLQASAVGSFFVFSMVFVALVGAILMVVYQSLEVMVPDAADAVSHALTLAFGLLAVLVGVVAWLYALSNESRDLARTESETHNQRLIAEIEAHEETDAALQKAKEAAEAANEAKSRYLLGITHELRTPLNAILGYAQLLESDPTVPAHRNGAVRVIRRSSEHLADLIEGLLDVSKIEAGRLDVSRDEVAFREMLDQLTAVFSMEAREKGLEFVSDIDASVPDFIFGDEKRLRQILINLLSNATRYTDEGSVRLAVSFRNDTARLVVEDTGRGIPVAMQETVFEPFERIQDPAKPVPGTGLGLTITKLLVEILGGELNLESTPGSGSRFEAVLFLSRSERVQAEAAQPVRKGYEGAEKHILICDDSAAHRRLMEDALGPLGFRVSMAETGEVALEFCKSDPPDLALVDQAMPGLSGSETCERIRQELGLTIPLIMVSANADAAPGRFPSPACHDVFLSKPVNVNQLLDTIGDRLQLSWRFEGINTAVASPLNVSRKVAGELSDALAIGHVAAVREVIEGAAARGGASPVFVSRARDLAERFDLRGLSNLIDEAGDGS
ncbi:MAG: ATP-binding protein [Pseudomonadota bacterium]